jgi:fructose-1,6-bisphosphatase/inositol monophosphatase family enzyme
VTSEAVANRFAADLDFARDAAERAGRIILARYERVEQVDYKSARDVVTEVDHLSEDLILAAIRQRFPMDGILAEESGAHRAEATEGGGGLAAGRTWVIDPLDGTINYANGIPFFCVSIGLVVDGRPAVGVIHDPMRGETFTADADGPARLGDVAVRVSDKELLSDGVVSLALGGRAVATRVQAIRKAIRVSRNMGSSALALAYVANGRFDAFVQSAGMSAWDVAAAGLIAERAGATVTDMTGGPWFDVDRATRTFGLLAASARHHPELLRLAREPG